MHFVNDDENPLSPNKLGVFNSRKKPLGSKLIKGQEQTEMVAGLLLAVVLVLHVGTIMTMMSSLNPPIKKPTPQLIEVSLLAAPVTQTKPQAAAPSQSPVPPVKKAAEPKTPLKPVVKKPKPLPPKPSAKPVETKADAPLPPVVSALPAVDAPNKPSVAVSASPKPPAPIAQPAPKADVRATCVSCPSLAFPAIAKRRGWQGVVVLKFELDASGQAVNIVVEQSSGHELLDEAAIENAKESRFSTQATEASRKVTKTYKFTIKEE